MRVPSIRILRRILIGVISVVMLAIALNFLIVALRKSRSVQPDLPMISIDLKRSAEGIEVLVHENAELRLKINARRLRETHAGKSILEDVDASDFNSDGGARSSIHSDEAEYDPEKKRVDFLGNVRVSLDNDIELFAPELNYDLNTGIGVIYGKTQMISRNASGHARGVSFFRNEKRLELESEIDFVLTHKSGNTDNPVDKTEEIHATSANAICFLESNRILFEGNVRVTSPEAGVLTGDSVSITLTSDRKQVISVVVDGQSAYEARRPDGNISLSGERMIFETGENGELKEILISGQAYLMAKTRNSEQTLRATRIRLDWDSRTNAFKEIQGEASVDFILKRVDEETHASGDWIGVMFAPDSGLLRDVQISGHAEFTVKNDRQAETRNLKSETNALRANKIHARFREFNGRAGVENLQADGDVRLNFSQGTDGANTLASSALEIQYAINGDYPESGSASGNAVIEEILNAATLRRRIGAEHIRFRFFPGNGKIRSLAAEKNVQTIQERKISSNGNPVMERYQTFSDYFESRFTLRAGEAVFDWASQWGNFRFRDGERSATADRCEYNVSEQKLVLTGALTPAFAEIVDGDGSRVSSGRIEYDIEKKFLRAVGGARVTPGGRLGKGSLFQASGNAVPVVVTADEVRYYAREAEQIGKDIARSTEVCGFRPAEVRLQALFQFIGNVRALSESQQLSARTLEITGDGDSLTAGGEVRHRLLQGAGAVIESKCMEYRRDRNTVHYAGGVSLESGEFSMAANILDGALDEKGENIRNVRAEGNVVARYQKRVCRGNAAEWIPEFSRYVITGDPVEIDDPEKGRSFARRLTYHQADDKIVLEK